MSRIKNMKILLLLIMLCQAHAKCVLTNCCDKYNIWKSHEDIGQVICLDINNGNVYLDRLDGDWARVIVDKKIIYYLTLVDKKWIIVAKGPRFDGETWDKFKIPEKIR